ncbi:hypothetical protein [Shewanella algae]|uniref:hypothetical protein n=1 Tax=Shewanella algae TaxID=38313 RepID=UPI001AAD8BF8|nr:hypothetical protein [Shewanella algae]MBO2700807.1 hypothetical protein [Shewanella algae]
MEPQQASSEGVVNRLKKLLNKDDIYLFKEGYRHYFGNMMAQSVAEDKKTVDLFFLSQFVMIENGVEKDKGTSVDARVTLNRPQAEFLIRALSAAVSQLEGEGLMPKRDHVDDTE